MKKQNEKHARGSLSLSKLATAFDRFVADSDPFAYASFERGVGFVAFNDDNASPEALEVEVVAGLISVITLSEAFSVPSEVVAYAVVAKRNEEIERANAEIKLPPTKAECDARRAARVNKPSDLLICDGCGKRSRRDSFGADADLLCRCPACVEKSAKRVARRLAKGGR